MELVGILTGLGLISIELIRSVPALLQVRKTKSSEGLSPSSLGVLAGTGLGWIVLAVIVNSPWVLAANVLWIVLHVMLCIEVARIDQSKLKRMCTLGFLTAVGVFLLTFLIERLVSFQDALGILLAIAMVVYAIPATLAGITSKTTRGLSVTSLSVNACEGFIYLCSGMGWVILSDSKDPVWGFILFGVVSIVSNGLRLMRVIYRRSRGLDSDYSESLSEVP
jgi:uncharacterized protein with PQ loop repeat